MFWSKATPRDFRQEVDKLCKTLTTLKDVEKSKEKVVSKTAEIRALVADVKGDLDLEADRLKSLPWIDKEYDEAIDTMLASEKKTLDQIDKNLGDYASMAGGVESQEDAKMIRELISSEADLLKKRDNETRAAVQNMEDATLKKRLKHASEPALPLHTKDGVPWSDVARAVRQLGGWIVQGSAHAQEVMFPDSTRPCPLSKDAGSQLLAKSISGQLAHLGPRKQLSLRQVQDALKAGDIHAAA